MGSDDYRAKSLLHLALAHAEADLANKARHLTLAQSYMRSPTLLTRTPRRTSSMRHRCGPPRQRLSRYRNNDSSSNNGKNQSPTSLRPIWQWRVTLACS